MLKKLVIVLFCQSLLLQAETLNQSETHPDRQSSGVSAVHHPVFKKWVKNDINNLKKQVAPVMKMTDSRLSELLPRQSGIFFVICPTPGCGNPQGSAFDWNPEKPSILTCKFCRNHYPSVSHPEQHTIRVTAPSGKEITYSYYLAPNGRKHYFSAGIEYRKAQYFSDKAYQLAQLYYLTGDEIYAQKAAVILCGIAEHYPDFAYKHEFPYKATQWYNGTPSKMLPHFRTSRWSWWGFMDVPSQLILTYDLIADSQSLRQYAKTKKIDLKKVVIDGFFLEACRGILRNPEKPFQNMTPTFWNGLAIAGKATGNQILLNAVQKGIENCLTDDFLFDGFWQEPSYSYHQQVVRRLEHIINCMNENSKPEDHLKAPFHLTAAAKLLNQMVYPDGRPVPMGDTWMIHTPEKAAGKRSSYLIPSVGYAMLGSGATQLHMAFTPKTGHHHYDTLGITFYSHGREMLSDMGYTHTKMYQFNLTTPAHNMVCVDFANHYFRDRQKGKGSIEYMDTANPRVQIIAVNAPNTQPGLTHNRRTLFLIRNGKGETYAADFYELGKGGRNYDYFLHGDADHEEQFHAYDAAGNPLLPVPHPIVEAKYLKTWKAPANNKDFSQADNPYFAYGYMTDTEIIPYKPESAFLRTDFSAESSTCSIYIPLSGAAPAVFHGRTPSIRKAKENNRNIRDFRQFICLRLNDPVDNPVFSTVIHPHQGNPAVRAVERLQANLLKINTGDRTDYLFIHQKIPLRLNGYTVSGRYGYLSFDKTEKLVNYHLVNAKIEGVADSGSPETRDIQETSGVSTLIFKGNTVSSPAPFIKIFNPETGIACGYFVQSLYDRTLTVKGNLGIRKKRNEDNSALSYFPHAKMPGKLQITFSQHVFR